MIEAGEGFYRHTPVTRRGQAFFPRAKVGCAGNMHIFAAVYSQDGTMDAGKIFSGVVLQQGFIVGCGQPAHVVFYKILPTHGFQRQAGAVVPASEKSVQLLP